MNEMERRPGLQPTHSLVKLIQHQGLTFLFCILIGKLILLLNVFTRRILFAVRAIS
jgi:hypothetical protein